MLSGETLRACKTYMEYYASLICDALNAQAKPLNSELVDAVECLILSLATADHNHDTAVLLVHDIDRCKELITALQHTDGKKGNQ